MTQSELARHADVSVVSLANWEQGSSLLSAQGYERLAMALNLSQGERALWLEAAFNLGSGPTDIGQRDSSVAAAIVLRSLVPARDIRNSLNDLERALGLTPVELGQLLGATESQVDAWKRGEGQAPATVADRLRLCTESLVDLQRLFLPERLPLVIRRPASLFDGDRALDWILQGRIRDVVDRYKRQLSYQA